MRSCNAALGLALLAPLLIAANQPLRAQTETLLYSFTGAADGGIPYAGLVRDPKGNLYGTTVSAGNLVFKLTPTGNESTILNFGDIGLYSGLIRDSKGNLYGTSAFGGGYGLGNVFKLTKKGTETTLYSFTGGTDGRSPLFGYLVRDAEGNLYGTTSGEYCGYDYGTVFEVTPEGKQVTLYTFTGGTDGGCPEGGLVEDKLGNLYGTTYWGGAYNNGTVLKLAPDGTETVLHSFKGGVDDGANPIAQLILDSAGNLYGTTYYGGGSNDGTVFKVSANGTESVLYEFAGDTDGANPFGSLVLDAKGNLYGTTYFGGDSNNGTVFEVTSAGVETVLHRFSGFPQDGGNPTANLILDKQRHLYGTTSGGGTYNWGTIFKVVP